MHETGIEGYYALKDGKKLRFGYTTGTCAAAAAKAATQMLVRGADIQTVDILTPKGIPLNLELLDIRYALGGIKYRYARIGHVREGLEGRFPRISAGRREYHYLFFQIVLFCRGSHQIRQYGKCHILERYGRSVEKLKIICSSRFL